MIREELKLRDERGELTHDKSPLLIKLTSLYRVTIFETKPQMFPMSSTASDKHLSKVNELGDTSLITLDDIKGVSRKSYRNSETVPQTTEHPKFAKIVENNCEETKEETKDEIDPSLMQSNKDIAQKEIDEVKVDNKVEIDDREVLDETAQPLDQ